MKLHELYDTNPMSEGLVQQAIGAAAVVIGMLSPSVVSDLQRTPIQALGNRTGADADQVVDQMSKIAASKYKVSSKLVRTIVASAVANQYHDFPRAKDILSIIGVESSFNPAAVSNLNKDPARGLMQVRPKVWSIDPANLKTIDDQIKSGATILNQYYKKLGNREAAIHAYNVGLTNHRKSAKNPAAGNPRYVPKVNAERQLYAGIGLDR